MRDGLRVCRPPGGFGRLEVDMTQAMATVEQFKRSGVDVNSNHVIFRAVALALLRHPEAHKIAAGSKVLYPAAVDLGISVAAESFVSPVMILKDAGTKDISAIARESLGLIRRAKLEDRKLRAVLRRWGWLVPFGWLRRAILRTLFNRTGFRRAGVGTFQISCLPGLDEFCPFLFNTAAILSVGGIRERVVVLEGKALTRPMLTLVCCFNHEVWDGRACQVFLGELRKILESGELKGEAPKYSTAWAG